MSFILDAINMSEQERLEQQGSPAPLAAQAVPAEVRPAWLSRWWLLVVLVVPLVLMLKNTFLPENNSSQIEGMQGEHAQVRTVDQETLSSTNPAAQAHINQYVTPVKSKIIAQEKIPKQPLATAKSTQRKTQQNADQRASGQVVTARRPGGLASESTVPLLTLLPYSVQLTLPDIDFSAHVYSGNQEGGFVVMNGSMRAPGERVAKGLYVVDILDNGVLMRFKETRFIMSSLKNWHAPEVE